MSLVGSAKRLVRRVPPAYRLATAVGHPSNRGHRLGTLARTVHYEIVTRGLGRPPVVPVGEHSKIKAYRGETNGPHAVCRNPPNWEMVVWKQRLQPGTLFVDVGANIGIYTIYALDLGAEVIAVEPTSNADRVREHLALNGYQATVIQKALSNRPGTVRITEGLDSFNHLVSEGGVEVEATTLDDILGGRTAASVKIDVEGAERLVLQGASRALAEHRIKLLQMEWAPGQAQATLGESRAPLAELLRSHGYVLHWPDRDGNLNRFDGDDSPTQDIFALPE